MRIKRYFTTQGIHPFNEVQWERRTATITHSDGSKVFEMRDIEVPQFWSSLATDVVASKYFRKAGVPKKLSGGRGHEYSVKQIINRVVRTIGAGSKKYFRTKNEIKNFEEELSSLILHQRLAFNSPVWFNCGLYREYGIKGTGGNFRVHEKTNKVVETQTAYQYPQTSACFIQSVSDDLMAIFELARNEARIFKYGSGTGTNFSKIRGSMEMLSGGGSSSGLMSFLEVLDKGAGAVKSGGTTRRAAKMVVLDVDHPEIKNFIQWKVREEEKLRVLNQAGLAGIDAASVSGQNSNNSVRVSDKFMRAVESKQKWQTLLRTSHSVHETFAAQDLWKQMGQAAWSCADPGLQFHTTINDWHTCPRGGDINASNPCSEYMFLDDSACNLASLNLLKFLNADGEFNVEAFRQAIRISIIAQEILVGISSYPTEKIARNSHDYRPLGLGYANLGALLIVKGLAYDSDAARSWASAITALMTGEAYLTSAQLAKEVGSFCGFKKNKSAMLSVLRKHRACLSKIGKTSEAPFHILHAANIAWNDALKLGKKHGFRNAQVTVLAPTGTIGLMMDCDTTGIEPDYSLVKIKKLAGGGSFTLINQSITRALETLGYDAKKIGAILKYALDKAHCLEGAPGLKPEHLAVFDCANPSGQGKRFIAPRGHLHMMAAVQPFLSGAISKTVNVPSPTTVNEITELYFEAWKLGLKSVAVYRNESKINQPLSVSAGNAGQFTAPINGISAPGCTECAHETIQEGTCFRCPNCGTTTGCG